MGFFDSVNNVGVGGDYDLPSTRYRATSTMTVGESREGHSALMLLRGRHQPGPGGLPLIEQGDFSAKRLAL